MEVANSLDDTDSRIQRAFKEMDTNRPDLSNNGGEYADNARLEPTFLTHLSSYDFSHIKLETFQADLSHALKGAFPSKANKYDGVYSLLIDWKDDDLGCVSEIRDLCAQLQTQFNFQTETFSIPTLNSERMLQDKLVDFERAHRDGSNLLLVYYGGHGQCSLQGDSVWRANLRQDSATVNWYLLQPILERSPRDVILIFDCCYAASAARSAPDGTTELLAACGRENPTSPVCDYSFTRVLMEELSRFGSSPFTVAQLHTRLIKERAKLRYTPIHAFISDENHPSITIAPLVFESLEGLSSSSLLETSDTPDSLSGKRESPLSDDESSQTTAPTTPSKSPAAQEPRVLLAVSLKHDVQSLDVEEWSKWITSGAPQGIQNISVRIEVAFASHSTLLLVSLPVSTWNLFPETSAYRFVDYIRSPDISMRLRLKENVPGIDAQDHVSHDDSLTPRAVKEPASTVALRGRKAIGDAGPVEKLDRARPPMPPQAASDHGSNYSKLSKKDIFSEDGTIDSPSPQYSDAGVRREDFEPEFGPRTSTRRQFEESMIFGSFEYESW